MSGVDSPEPLPVALCQVCYEADLLGVAAGAPAFLLTNRAFDRHNAVLVYSFVLLRGDYFRISISLPPRAATEVTEMVRPEMLREAGGTPWPAKRGLRNIGTEISGRPVVGLT